MALVFNDRVKETSVTTGTGTLTLDGAVQGFETFSSAIGNSNTTYYAIELPGTTEFEVGRGTVSAGQLARTQVISSSNSDSPVDFSAGTKIVFCTLPASKAVIKDASGNIPIDANKTIEFGDSGETISGDGTHLTIAGSDHINVNAQGELTLSSESNEIFFRDGSTLFLKVQRDGDFNVNFTSNQDKKIEFIGNDGGSTVDMLVLDGAEAGKATFNDKVILGANKVIEFGDAGETISGNGTDLTIASSGFININASSDVKLNAAGNDIRLYSSATEFLRLTHSSGDAIINSLVSDKDIKFQGNDGGSGITALTLDMSEAGAATFNSTVTANAGLKADNITIDGTEIDLSSGDLTIDVAGDITLDADGGDIIFADASTEIGRFTNDSTDFAIHSSVQDKDIVFKGNDGGSTITAMRLDMSNKGRVSIGSNSFPAERLSVFGENNSAAATFKVKDTDSRGVLIESPYSGFGVGYVGTDGTNSALGFKVNGTEVSRFHTNGFLGIGTTNPQEEIHINGADPSIRIQDSDGGLTTITQAGNDLTIDSPNDIILDGDQSIKYMDGGSLYMSLSNSSGIRFTSQISDNDMLFRGNDGGSFITALTLDMSEAGAATFNDKVILGANKVIEFGDSGETISGDGTDMTVSSSGILNLNSSASTGAAIKLTPSAGGVLIDSFSLIVLDADNADNGIQYKDGATEMLRIHNSSSDVILHTKVQDKDLIFKGNDGGSDITPMMIDMSEGGRVGIFGSGTTVPAAQLHVATDAGGVKLQVTGSSSSVTPGNDADEIFVDNAGNAGVTIGSGTSSKGSIHFGDSGDNDIGMIEYDHSSNSLAFTTDAAERIRVDSSGRVGIGTNSPSRDLHVKKSTSGSPVRLEVNNTSNTGASHGVVSIYSGGTSGGDPYLHFKVDGGEQYSIGIDNDQSDALVFSNNFGVGSTNLLSIETDGSATFTGTVTANGGTLVSAGFAVAMAIAL